MNGEMSEILHHQCSSLLCHQQISLLTGVWDNLDLIGYTGRLDVRTWGTRVWTKSQPGRLLD